MLGAVHLFPISGSALMSTDVAVNSHTHITVVSVHLRHSKIDIFGAGTWGVLMVTSAQLMPCWDISLFGVCPLAPSFSSQMDLPFPVPALWGQFAVPSVLKVLSSTGLTVTVSGLGQRLQLQHVGSLTPLSKLWAVGSCQHSQPIFVPLYELWL